MKRTVHETALSLSFSLHVCSDVTTVPLSSVMPFLDDGVSPSESLHRKNLRRYLRHIRYMHCNSCSRETDVGNRKRTTLLEQREEQRKEALFVSSYSIVS